MVKRLQNASTPSPYSALLQLVEETGLEVGLGVRPEERSEGVDNRLDFPDTAVRARFGPGVLRFQDTKQVLNRKEK